MNNNKWNLCQTEWDDLDKKLNKMEIFSNYTLGY